MSTNKNTFNSFAHIYLRQFSRQQVIEAFVDECFTYKMVKFDKIDKIQALKFIVLFYISKINKCMECSNLIFETYRIPVPAAPLRKKFLFSDRSSYAFRTASTTLRCSGFNSCKTSFLYNTIT